MSESEASGSAPIVIVIADDQANADHLIERILRPAGIQAFPEVSEAPKADVLVVDVTLLRGDPFAGLRNRRSSGDEAPAVVLAAHIPAVRLRDLFRLGVADVLLKPFRPVDLAQAVYELSQARSAAQASDLLSQELHASQEKAKRRTEEIRILSEIGRVIAGLRGLDEILKRVVEAAAFLTNAEEASIYLAEPGSEEVVLRASKQANDSRASLPTLRVTDTLAGAVFRSGKPILRQPESESGPVKVQTGFLVQSLIKVPLRVGDEVVGVLGVYNRLTPRKFTDHHLTLLMALADWTGVALEQAETPAAQRAPRPVDPGVITAAPPQLGHGLDEIQLALENLLDGGGEPLHPIHRELLTAIQARLRELGNLPMAMLDPGEAKDLVDLPGIIMQILDQYQPIAVEKGLELVAEPAFPIPLFTGDHDRIRQVIEALVEKAFLRTRRGRIVLEVHRFEALRGVSSEMPLPPGQPLEDGMWLGVRVADTSSGLSPDTIRALSTDRAEPDMGKAGPGLSMGEIRMITESLGGVLWFDQTPASTSITLALPMK